MNETQAKPNLPRSVILNATSECEGAIARALNVYAHSVGCLPERVAITIAEHSNNGVADARFLVGIDIALSIGSSAKA